VRKDEEVAWGTLGMSFSLFFFQKNMNEEGICQTLEDARIHKTNEQ
jgi:hypothetical protein